jgi:peptidylprolyl isomerase
LKNKDEANSESVYERIRIIIKGENMFKILLVASLVVFGLGAHDAKGSKHKDIEELVVKDITIGTGAEAKDGNTVTVHYTGRLTNHKKFDSSKDRNQPFSFQLGRGEVIKGWDRGVKGMKVGGKRKLIIPAFLGYGDRGAGADIPPGATLLFDIELLNVE